MIHPHIAQHRLPFSDTTPARGAWKPYTCPDHQRSTPAHGVRAHVGSRSDRSRSCNAGGSSSTHHTSTKSCPSTASSCAPPPIQAPPRHEPPPAPPAGLAAVCSRRAAAAAAAGVLLAGHTPLPAWALRTIELKDGSSVDVYEHGMSLEIVALRGSIPQQWIIDFRQGLGKYAGFQLGQRKQLQDLYDELGKPGEKRSAGAADVVTVGDSWLAPAIRQRLLQPVPSAETYRWWRRLPHRWQQLVRRDPVTGLLSESGPVWGCPYRWGALLLAYKKDLLLRPRRQGHAITTWADLLQPALKGRVAFPDNPREFLGVAFKTLGHPRVGFNATRADLAAAGFSPEDVRARVRQLRGQARLFSAQEHVRALMVGDVWVCIGSSTDLVPLSERANSVELLAPADGTNLWADVWAVPAHAEHGHLCSGPSPILPSWLEFSISPARAEVLNGLKEGASPILLPYSAEEHARTTAAAAAAAAASSSTSSSGNSGGGRGWLGRGGGKRHQEAQRLQQQLAEQERQQRQREQQQLQERQQRVLYDAAIAAQPPALKLAQSNHFMPPDSVLEQSEFMLPRDADTLDLYNWLLA